MQRQYRFFVLVVSILAVNLLTNVLEAYLVREARIYRPLVGTVIGMAVVGMIFYPLFTHLDRWATGFSRRFIQAGKKVMGRRIGAFAAFGLAIFILYVLYAKVWYDVNVLRILTKRILLTIR